jgi:RND superfamily putative drug exporter
MVNSPVVTTHLRRPTESPQPPGPAREPRPNIPWRAAAWSVRHRRTAIGGWLLFVVIATLLGGMLGTKQITDAQAAVGEDAQAQRAISAAHLAQPASESVLLTRPAVAGQPPLAQDPAIRAAVQDLVQRLTATGQARDITSPFSSTGAVTKPDQLSKNGRSVLVSFDVVGDKDKASSHVAPLLAATAATAHAHPGLRIEEAGDASADKTFGKVVGTSFHNAELLAIPLTLGILLAVFGAVVAALLPVALSMTAFIAATGLLAFTSRIWALDKTTNSVMLLIGLAVGVDYALFYLRREREERARGASPDRALAIAARTSGHAVLVSGATVAVSMAGIGFTGMSVFTSMASGTVLVVLIAVLGSLTVLPAMLSWLGDRVEAGGLPGGRRRRARRVLRDPRVAGALVDGTIRRPRLVAGMTIALLVALAIPALVMRTGDLGVNDLPRTNALRQTTERIDAAFPGTPMPAQAVVQAADVRAPAVQALLSDLQNRTAHSSEMSAPVKTQTSSDHRVTVVSIPLAGNGNDATSRRALHTLRTEVIPATLHDHPGIARIAVTGNTASDVDWTSRLHERAPLVVGFVLVLAFALLFGAFRSLRVAIAAVGSTLLSVGASYGLLTLIFQHHWADGLLHYNSAGRIVPWLPLFLFVVLFGLSTDYQVFVLSRIQEGVQAGLPVREAIRQGVRRTAGVVTSAATIMVAVFSVFACLSLVTFKEMGVGLAAAVLLDATVVRVILMPALLLLLGDKAWRRTRKEIPEGVAQEVVA